MANTDALILADRAVLLANIRRLRDAGINAHARAVRAAGALDAVVIILSTITAGSLWFLCSSAGPLWLNTTVKWVGAVFSTICATVTAYKEKITNFRRLSEDAFKHTAALENLIFRAEEGDSTRSVHEAYRSIKAELTRVLVELKMRKLPTTGWIVGEEETSGVSIRIRTSNELTRLRANLAEGEKEHKEWVAEKLHCEKQLIARLNALEDAANLVLEIERKDATSK